MRKILALVGLIAISASACKQADANKTANDIVKFKQQTVGLWSANCTTFFAKMGRYKAADIQVRLLDDNTASATFYLYDKYTAKNGCETTSQTGQPDTRTFDFTYDIKENPQVGVGRIELTEVAPDSSSQNPTLDDSNWSIKDDVFLNLKIDQRGGKFRVGALDGTTIHLVRTVNGKQVQITVPNSAFIDQTLELSK